jgi:hypothetical protein
MNPLIMQGIIKIGENLIDRFIPNETENAKAKLELIKETNNQDFQLLVKQIETNANEAKNPNVFVAGWRPFIGWISGVSLGLIYIPKALVLTGVWTYQAITIISAWNGIGPPPTMPDYPDLGVSDLIGLLMSMLGIATLRTVDKIQGVSTKETK